MILLLGKYHTIKQYAGTNDMIDCPSTTTHYTDFWRYIQFIKDEQPLIVTTQSAEMIDVLLESDLDFNVVTVKSDNGVIKSRTLTKEEAKEFREKFGIELR